MPRAVRPSEVPAPSFQFCVSGPAVSARTKNRSLLREWLQRVAEAAHVAWSEGGPPLQGDLTVSISEFSASSVRDRDNLAKPVLDAMQGIVYVNDRQVKSLQVD